MECGLTIDPTAVQAALNACMALLERPDSAANFLRGAFVVAIVLAVALGTVDVLRSAVRR
jgi:hypothetical protein